MKSVRSSNLGGLMRCRNYLRVSKNKVDVTSDAANFGSAFHRARELARKGEVVDYSAIQAQYGLTLDELDELKRMQWRVQRDYSDWNLTTETELACDEHLQPVKVGDKRAILTGHPDVVAFHRVHGNMAQVTDDKTSRMEQLDHWQILAYVALVLANFPDVDTVDARLDYNRLGYSVGRVDKDGNPMPYTRSEYVTSFWPRIVQTIKEAKKRSAEYTVGIQCSRCAPWACPAWNQFRQLLANGNINAVLASDATTAERAAFVIDWLPKLKVWQRALDEVEASVRGIGQQQSVELGDDTMYEDRPSTVIKLDGAKTLPWLLTAVAENGQKLGEILGDFSKTDVANVVKKLMHDGTVTGKKGELIQRALDELKALGAVRTEQRSRVSVYSVKEGQSEEL